MQKKIAIKGKRIKQKQTNNIPEQSVYERIYRFNSKSERKRNNYANQRLFRCCSKLIQV